jgi:ADP-ribosylation factor GTPase-activating protein 2/3
MYFGRGTYDPAASSEAQSRLKDFSEEGGPSGGQGGDDLNDTLAGLERGVRDAAGRLMANPDVQNLTDQIRQGALKVSSYVPYGIRTDV